jgi:hypothetical protein
VITIDIDSGKCTNCDLSLFKVEEIFQLGPADLQVETMPTNEIRGHLENVVTLSPSGLLVL